MKKMKNKLDERQEQKLLQIEHNGCWFAFWALAASLFIQQMLLGIGEWKYVAGEWVIFMCLALYLMFACVKNGIWDRRLEANTGTNFLVSLLSSVVFGIIIAVINYFHYHSIGGAVATFAVFTVVLFAAIFAALSASMVLFKKNVRSMEEDFDEEEKN